MKSFIFVNSILCVLAIFFVVAVAQDPDPPVPPPLPEDSITTTITVSFSNPNPAEARAAQWRFAQANQVRVAHGYEPYADIGEMCTGIIKRNVINWIAQEAESRENEQDVKILWKDATDAQRAAAIAALQAAP